MLPLSDAAQAPPAAGETVPPASDQDLLRSWRSGGNGADFTELVRRHFPLVRGVARRQLGEDLAEDTAQTVFTILARKAPDARCLSAWLHRVTVLQCREAVRRRMREQRVRLAATELASASSPETRDPLEDALPHLDEAISTLGDRDRELLLLRYSEGLSFRDAAARTGRREEALRRQAGRALEKLSHALRRRGVPVPAAALAAGLGSSLQGPPAAHAAAVASAATAGTAALSGLSLFSLTLATMTAVQSAAAGALTAALLSAIPLGWQAYQMRGAASPDPAAPVSLPKDPTPPPPATAKAGTASTGAQRAAASAPLPPEKVMEELERELEEQAIGVIRDQAMSLAWMESRGISLVLGLSPDRETALRAALEVFRQNRVEPPAGHEDHSHGESDSKERRREFRKARDTWLHENLTPEEFAKYQDHENARKEALIASNAEEALHRVSSKVALTEEQKTKLFDAAAARAAETLEKDDYEESMMFTGTLERTPAPPVEEAAAELVAGILDPEQRQLWEESQSRSRYTREDMPRRLVDRALDLTRQRGLLSIVAALMRENMRPIDSVPSSIKESSSVTESK